MEWILVRHAEPKIERSADDAPANPGLTARGSWQAERLCEWLACEPVDAVVTSPKRRAQDTVAPLVKHLGIEPFVAEDLDEIDRYARFYAPFQVIPRYFPDVVAQMERQDWEGLGWDPPARFAERVQAQWDALVADPPGEHVVVACHGGVIGVIVSHALGLGWGSGVATSPFAAVTRLRGGPAGGLQLATLNEDAHFDGERAHRVGWEGKRHGFDDEVPEGLGGEGELR